MRNKVNLYAIAEAMRETIYDTLDAFPSTHIWLMSLQTQWALNELAFTEQKDSYGLVFHNSPYTFWGYDALNVSNMRYGDFSLVRIDLARDIVARKKPR